MNWYQVLGLRTLHHRNGSVFVRFENLTAQRRDTIENGSSFVRFENLTAQSVFVRFENGSSFVRFENLTPQSAFVRFENLTAQKENGSSFVRFENLIPQSALVRFENLTPQRTWYHNRLLSGLRTWHRRNRPLSGLRTWQHRKKTGHLLSGLRTWHHREPDTTIGLCQVWEPDTTENLTPQRHHRNLIPQIN